MPDKGRTRKYMEHARKISKVQSLTSSGESVDSCAARETSASLDFFDRLVLRDTGIFLVEALVALGDFTADSVSCTRGSLVITSPEEGAAAASLFGSLSSLQVKGNRFYTTRKEESKYSQTTELGENLRCHEVKKFNIFFLNRGFTSRSSLSRGTR
jgi:hypothetical protein